MISLRYYSRSFAITGEMIRSFFSPRKKDSSLFFESIGLTITVPAFLTVLSERQRLARSRRSSKKPDLYPTSFATGDDTHTLFVARNAENNYMSGLTIALNDRKPVQAKNEYYEFLQSQLNTLKDQYKAYAKVQVEEQSVDGSIGGLPFEKTEITVRVPGETFYYAYYYHGFHKGFQVLLCTIFSSEKKGMDMVERIEEARFA